MVDVTIDDLLSIGTNQAPDANTIIQQTGISFRARTRPNPPLVINVSSEAQLVASLGSELIIPNNVDLTITIDEAFSLSLPIKVGNNSGLEFRSSKVGPILTWTGTGALIQNNVPGVDESSFVFLENLSVTGNNTNSFIDIKLASPNGFAVMTSVNLASLASIGTIDSSTLIINRLTGFVLAQGMIIRNGVSVRIDNVILSNFATTNTTWFSVIDSIPIIFSIRDVDVSNITTGDSFLFLDPNAVAGSSFIINGSRIVQGDFYQLGVNIAINSVADDGSGNARFTTAASHGLVVGKVVVLSAFAGQATYNGTFIVTAVDTPLTGTTFDVEEITFVATDSGNMNASSLDQTNILVTALGNTNTPNSQIIGSAFTNSNAVVTTITSPDTFQDIDFGALTPSVSLERFLLSDVVNGEFTYTGINSRKSSLSMSLTMRKVSGSTQIYHIKFVIDKGSGFVNFADNIILPFEVKTSNDNGTYICQAQLDTGDKIKPQISGIGTSDSIIVDSTSINF